MTYVESTFYVYNYNLLYFYYYSAKHQIISLFWEIYHLDEHIFESYFHLLVSESVDEWV